MTQYSGKVIRKTPVTPTQQSASGVWKLNEQAAAIRNNSWPVPGVPDPISRSVRLRSSASAYFNRTPATASNRKTWTWSGWIKRGLISGSGTYEIFMGDNYSTSFTGIRFYNDTVLVQDYVSGSKNIFWQTNGLLRDPSAWYHIVVKYDTTQASSTNSVLIYLNGVSQTLTFTANTGSYVQNYDGIVNSTNGHKIGALSTIGNYLDGYLTEINFVDGQALTPSSFGTTDTATGAWIPMPYTGTYGTNGFYLNFKDNTSTTTIGYDYSGNANNWTANNISLTAGSTYDSMLDVPTPWVGYSTTTDTSAVTRGNYAVLNPVEMNPVGTRTISNGNLDVSLAYTSGVICYGTMGVPTSGKWYWEVTATTVDSANASPLIGVFRIDDPAGTSYDYTNSVAYRQSGVKQTSAGTAAYGNSFTNGDVIGIAVDATNQAVYFSKNGVWQNSGDPTSGATKTGAALTSLPQQVKPGIASSVNTTTSSFNFGQRPLSYSPPAGYSTLVTTNLPTPTITNGANYMAASTYTGNGTSQSIVNSGNNTAAVSFKPDLIWTKGRSGVTNHSLVDSVRGSSLQLSSNQTIAEVSDATEITAFNTNGFSVGNSTGAGISVNANGTTYVGWQWKAGAGTTSSNTSGSITSTVSVNTTAGFSVVTYTGNGTTGTVGHGLGVAPSMIIVKNRTTAGTNWPVWHTSLTNETYALYLDTTLAQGNTNNPWGSGSISSTTFHVTATGTTNSNQSSANYVAYCWAAVDGYSAFGKYTGNGSSDGPFVYLGFRPRFLLLKVSSTTGDWVIYDTSRNTYNVMDLYLYPDSSAAEAGSGTPRVDALSNGFKLRNTGQDNTSSATYIFAAFAENPFKYSNAR